MAMPIGRRSQGHSSVRNRRCEAHRHGDQHGDDGGDDGAVDRRGAAELVGNRVPYFGDQELEAEGLKCRQRAVDQRDNDAGEDDQHRDGGDGSSRFLRRHQWLTILSLLY